MIRGIAANIGDILTTIHRTGNLARPNSSAYSDGARAADVVLERAHESKGVPEGRLGVSARRLALLSSRNSLVRGEPFVSFSAAANFFA